MNPRALALVVFLPHIAGCWIGKTEDDYDNDEDEWEEEGGWGEQDENPWGTGTTGGSVDSGEENNDTTGGAGDDESNDAGGEDDSGEDDSGEGDSGEDGSGEDDGPSDTDWLELTGNTYLLDLGTGDWVRPSPLIGGLLGDGLDNTLLLSIQAETADTIEVIGALTKGDTAVDVRQDVCMPTLHFDDSDFTDHPYFSVGPTDLPIELMGTSLNISQMSLTGIIDDDGEDMYDIGLSGVLDMRELGEALGDTDVGLPVDFSDPESTCDLFASILGFDCNECPSDGEPYCVELELDEIVAESVDVTVVPISVDAIHPECESGEWYGDDEDWDDDDADGDDEDWDDDDDEDWDDGDGSADGEGWPYSGAYAGSLVMIGETWGEWCYGSMDVTVESDGAIDGEGFCDWDLPGYGAGIAYFYPSGWVAEDGIIDGSDLYVDSSPWGAFEGEVSGTHSAEDTEIVMGFMWGWQYMTVIFTRD